VPGPDLGNAVASAIERSVLPSVVARGGGLRVVAVEGGVVTLEARGSPGATLPILSRLDAQLRAAVPGIAGVRVVEPGGPSPP